MPRGPSVRPSGRPAVRRPICRFLTRGHFLACFCFFLGADFWVVGLLPAAADLADGGRGETEQNSAAASHNTFTADRKIKSRIHDASFKDSINHATEVTSSTIHGLN